eukprot:2509296-Amphidinium_carterae.1
MRQALKDYALPGLGADLLERMSIQHILYLALATKSGVGKTRSVQADIKWGDQTISLKNMTRKTVASDLRTSVASVTGLLSLACYIVVFLPSEQEIDEWNALDLMSYN